MKALLSMFMILFVFSGLNLLAQNDKPTDLKINLEKTFNKFRQALLDGDYNTIASVYTDDAVSLPSYQPIWRGKDEILAGNKEIFKSGTKFQSFTAKTVDVFSSGDIAYLVGTYEISITMPNNTTAMNDHGKFLNVYQKQSDGSWKVKADTWNSDVNPMSLNQAGAKSKDEYGK